MNTIACFPYNRRRLRTVIVSAVDIRISTGRNLFFVLCLFQLLRSFYSSIINHFGFHATKNTPTIIHWIIMNKKTTRRRWEKFWFQLGIFKRNELIFECSTFLFICKAFFKDSNFCCALYRRIDCIAAKAAAAATTTRAIQRCIQCHCYISQIRAVRVLQSNINSDIVHICAMNRIHAKAIVINEQSLPANKYKQKAKGVG